MRRERDVRIRLWPLEVFFTLEYNDPRELVPWAWAWILLLGAGLLRDAGVF